MDKDNGVIVLWFQCGNIYWSFQKGAKNTLAKSMLYLLYNGPISNVGLWI